MEQFFKDAAEFFPILLHGAKLTVVVAVGSLLLSTVLGLFWALMRVSGITLLEKISAGIINVLRGIPIIVMLFYIYFVLPDLGIALSAVQAAIIGLGIAYSAYQAENFRAGIPAATGRRHHRRHPSHASRRHCARFPGPRWHTRSRRA